MEEASKGKESYILSLTLSKGARKGSPVKYPVFLSSLKKVYRGLGVSAIREFLYLPPMGLP